MMEVGVRSVVLVMVTVAIVQPKIEKKSIGRICSIVALGHVCHTSERS